LSLTGQSILVSSGRLAASLSRWLVGIMVARIFGEQLGFTAEYQKVWLLFNTTFYMFVFGIPQSIYYFFPRMGKTEKQNFLQQCYLLFFIFGILFWVFLKLTAPFAAAQYNSPELVIHMNTFAFYGFAMLASAFTEPVLNVLQHFKVLAFFMLFEALLFAACALGPLYLNANPEIAPELLTWVHGHWSGLASESAAIQFSLTLITLLAFGRLIVIHLLLYNIEPAYAWRKIKITFSSIVKQLKYALPISATTLVAYIALFIDKNVVATHFSEGGVYALYEAGAREVPVVSVIVGSVMTVLLPHISRMQEENKLAELSDLLAKSAERIAWIIFPSCTILMVVADLLFVLIYGPQYEVSAGPFRLYLLVFPLRILFYGQVLNTLGKARTVLWLAILDLIFNLLLSLWFVRIFGMIGPAMATVIATVAEIVVFIFLVSRALQQPLSRIFVPGRLGKIAIFALLAGLAAYGGRFLFDTKILQFANAVVFWAFAYGLLLLFSGDGRKLFATLKR
jgi:O-antigen/teichoic acid export membrane protein